MKRRNASLVASVSVCALTIAFFSGQGAHGDTTDGIEGVNLGHARQLPRPADSQSLAYPEDDPPREPANRNIMPTQQQDSLPTTPATHSTRADLQPQEEARLQWGGWLAQGFTGNPNQPSNGLNRPVLFNDRANEYVLDQFYLYGEYALGSDMAGYDASLRLDLTYGYDSHFVTVPGLERHQNRSKKWNAEDERYGLALPQAYVELTPAATQTFSLKLGHFYSTAGYERFAAPDNLLYSHSYSFGFATPFTQTGALARFSPHGHTSWYLGYTQGWDAWDSAANEWGLLGGVTLESTDGERKLSLVIQAGDDIRNIMSGGAPLIGDRASLHAVYQQQLSEQFRYILNPVFGYQQGAVAVANIGPSTITFDDAQWYGVTQYLVWTPEEWCSGVLRFEWFRDEDQSRIGTPVDYNPGGPVLSGGNYFELTAGLNVLVSPHARLRPELRWDWSDVRGSSTVPGGDPTVRAFGDRTDGSQITLATDLIITF